MCEEAAALFAEGGVLLGGASVEGRMGSLFDEGDGDFFFAGDAVCLRACKVHRLPACDVRCARAFCGDGERFFFCEREVGECGGVPRFDGGIIVPAEDGCVPCVVAFVDGGDHVTRG